jgi:hypothetical protein
LLLILSKSERNQPVVKVFELPLHLHGDFPTKGNARIDCGLVIMYLFFCFFRRNEIPDVLPDDICGIPPREILAAVALA